jgi:hypothetical protein
MPLSGVSSLQQPVVDRADLTTASAMYHRLLPTSTGARLSAGWGVMLGAAAGLVILLAYTLVRVAPYMD